MITARRLGLPPDAFAVVMATGIVAIAARDHRLTSASLVLGDLATAVFAALAVVWIATSLAHRGDTVADFRDPDVALRMFTAVAGACVLGVVWIDDPGAVAVFAVVAVVVWLLLLPLAIRDVRSRPAAMLRDHAHGAWLLISVATSGLATTAADEALFGGGSVFLALGLALWVLAWVLYVAVTALIVWRGFAHGAGPHTVTPDAWILMGALAIAALAGAHLTGAAAVVAPGAAAAVRGSAFAVWVVGSAWIPLLVVGQLWRFATVTGALRFANVWWAAVFPLGMYASATAAIGEAVGIAALAPVSVVATWIALAAWLLAAIGVARSGARAVRGTAR